MPRLIVVFVRSVDRLNYGIGRFAMYLLFALMAVLLWSTVSKAFFYPSNWTLETAQFIMVAYYILGGPYSMQLGSHVRMDLLYANWSPKKRAWWDLFTVMLLIFYLGVLLWGAIDSTAYAFQYGERSATAWRPYLWPIKLIMCFGFVLMILQSLTYFFRDIATIRGEVI